MHRKTLSEDRRKTEEHPAAAIRATVDFFYGRPLLGGALVCIGAIDRMDHHSQIPWRDFPGVRADLRGRARLLGIEPEQLSDYPGVVLGFQERGAVSDAGKYINLERPAFWRITGKQVLGDTRDALLNVGPVHAEHVDL